MTSGSIITIRVADMPDGVVGSVIGNCSECGEQAWLSTSSQNILQEASELGVEIGVCCNHCIHVLEERDRQENPHDAGIELTIEPDNFVQKVKARDAEKQEKSRRY